MLVGSKQTSADDTPWKSRHHSSSFWGVNLELFSLASLYLTPYLGVSPNASWKRRWLSKGGFRGAHQCQRGLFSRDRPSSIDYSIRAAHLLTSFNAPAPAPAPFFVGQRTHFPSHPIPSYTRCLLSCPSGPLVPFFLFFFTTQCTVVRLLFCFNFL